MQQTASAMHPHAQQRELLRERSKHLPKALRTHAIDPDSTLCALGLRQDQVAVVQPGNKVLHRPVAPHPLREALRSGVLALSADVFVCRASWGGARQQTPDLNLGNNKDRGS